MRSVFLPEALTDLHQIWDYIANQSKSVEQAFHVIETIRDRAVLYAQNPELGIPRFEWADGLRCFSVAG